MAEHILVNSTLDCDDTISLLDLVTRQKGELLEKIKDLTMEQPSGEVCIHGEKDVGQIEEFIELLQTLLPLVHQHVQSKAECRGNKGRRERDSGMGSTTSAELQFKKNTDNSSLPWKTPSSSSDNGNCKLCSRRQSPPGQEHLLRSSPIKDKSEHAFKRQGFYDRTTDNSFLPEDLDNKLHENEDDLDTTMTPEDKPDYFHIHQQSQTHPKSLLDSRPEEKTEEDNPLDADAKDGAGKKEKDVI